MAARCHCHLSNWAPAFAGVEVEWVLGSIEGGVAMYEAAFRSPANAGR